MTPTPDGVYVSRTNRIAVAVVVAVIGASTAFGLLRQASIIPRVAVGIISLILLFRALRGGVIVHDGRVLVRNIFSTLELPAAEIESVALGRFRLFSWLPVVILQTSTGRIVRVSNLAPSGWISNAPQIEQLRNMLSNHGRV